jgi:hypothetical protein
MSSFDAAFSPAFTEMMRVMADTVFIRGQTVAGKGIEIAAIIETADQTTQNIPGARAHNLSCAIHVTRADWLRVNGKKGDIVLVKDQATKIMMVQDDGTDGMVLLCEPVHDPKSSPSFLVA